jgi:hypothetical protein
MARSSILLPQWLQLYVQLLHISEPSPSSSRFASESRRLPHVLQRKQSMCHRFPAVQCQCAIRRQVRAGAVGKARGTWCLAEICIPSSNALPSSRIWTAVSDCAPRAIGPVLPLRTPCTDTPRRPGRSATLGMLRASPCCFSAADVRVRKVLLSTRTEWPRSPCGRRRSREERPGLRYGRNAERWAWCGDGQKCCKTNSILAVSSCAT